MKCIIFAFVNTHQDFVFFLVGIAVETSVRLSPFLIPLQCHSDKEFFNMFNYNCVCCVIDVWRTLFVGNLNK